MLRYRLCVMANNHQEAMQIAESLTVMQPDVALHWVWLSESMEKTVGAARAYERLRAASSAFRSEPMIPFRLACLAARLGSFGESRNWLSVTFAVASLLGMAATWKQRAIREPALNDVLSPGPAAKA